MTEWKRTMILATNETRIKNQNKNFWQPPQHQLRSTSSPEAELQRNLQTLNISIWTSMFQRTPTYTFRKSSERVVELLRSKYVPILGSSWQFAWNKSDVLTTNSQWKLVIAVVNFLYLETYSQYNLICSTEHLRRRLWEVTQFWLQKQYGIQTSFV